MSFLDRIGRASVRCGLCCGHREPCAKCAIRTQLANWHTEAQGRLWALRLRAIELGLPSWRDVYVLRRHTGK